MILKINILVFTAIAALMDLRWWKVKNCWILAGLAGGITYQLLCDEGTGILRGLIGMMVPVLLLGAFWYFRKIGAGDIKLFSVVGLWTGGVLVLEFLLFSLLAGAAVFFLTAALKKPSEGFMKQKVHVAVYAFISALCLAGGVYE